MSESANPSNVVPIFAAKLWTAKSWSNCLICDIIWVSFKGSDDKVKFSIGRSSIISSPAHARVQEISLLIFWVHSYCE